MKSSTFTLRSRARLLLGLAGVLLAAESGGAQPPAGSPAPAPSIAAPGESPPVPAFPAAPAPAVPVPTAPAPTAPAATVPAATVPVTSPAASAGLLGRVRRRAGASQTGLFRGKLRNLLPGRSQGS